MLFTEGRFFLFFLAVFVVHWGLRAQRARKLWLLGTSYLFYAGWDARFLALILLSTVVDYLCGRAMAASDARSRAARPDIGVRELREGRRRWLLLSVVVNLGVLGFFKYFQFFVDSAVEFSRWLGFEANVGTLGIVLPVGISFYTFQTMSYTIDAYRGRLAPIRDPLDFALFVAFFPQLVAGPIVRATEFLPQLREPRRFDQHVAVRTALWLFLVGFFKKACLADGIAVVVDPVFAEPAAYSTGASWLCVALYHVQIYCDFSGYSDMAIASAGLLGYRLPENFRFPYFAAHIGEFWRRWHISLAGWLRDYLYLPLVGPHASARRRNVMLLVSLGLCGLWHGAGWNFVAFGLMHGLYLMLGELWLQSPWRRGALARVAGFLGMPFLTLLILLTWPVFRIGGFVDTSTMFSTLFGLRDGGPEELSHLGWYVLTVAIVLHWIGYRRPFEARLRSMPTWLFPIAYGFAWSMVLPWVADDAVPFIYFQF